MTRPLHPFVLRGPATPAPTRCADPFLPGREWLLCFSACVPSSACSAAALPGVEARVAIVRISGIRPSQLRCVQIDCNDIPELEIDSISDGCGRRIPAGVLLQSMAAMEGRSTMDLDVRERRLPTAATTITLRVQSDRPQAAEVASVQVLLLQ